MTSGASLSKNTLEILQNANHGALMDEQSQLLSKAFSVGYPGLERPTERTGLGALVEESLDSVLKIITAKENSFKFWPSISIGTATQTTEGYMRKIAYGDNSNAYVAEGGVGQEEDSVYVRDAQKLAIFSKSRSITYIATKVKTSIGDLQVEQQKDATMSILKTVERDLYWGHSYFVNSNGEATGSVADLPPSSIEMSGLLSQVMKGDKDSQFIAQDFSGFSTQEESVVKDLEGAALTQDNFEDGMVVVQNNFGMADKAHAAPAVISSFVKTFYPQFRSAPGLSGQTVGYDVSSVMTSAGKLELVSNVFLSPRGKVLPGASSPKAANVGGITLAGAAAGSGSKLLAGNYHYAVTLVNDFGESAPIYTSVAVAVADGQKVTLTLTGAVPSGVKYIRVYRSAASGSAASAQFIQCCRLGSPFVDAGFKLPGLGEVYMFKNSSETLEFKQLIPLTKIALAVTTSAFPSMFIMCGGLFVFAPRWCYILRNAGR
jgi:hypothetical protein